MKMDKKEKTLDQINEEYEQSFMLNNLINSIPGGVGIFTFGDRVECEYFSDGFHKMGGMTREEMQGIVDDKQILEKLVAPVDYDYVKQNIIELSKKGSSINLTYRCVIKDGSIKWLHLTAKKMRERDGLPIYYCVFTSPTNETALYQSIVEDSAMGVFVADCETRSILYANNEAKATCGFTPDVDISGQSVVDFLPKMGASPLLTTEEIASLSKDEYTEFHVERKNKYFDIRAKALSWNGIDSYILYISNETIQQQNHIQLQSLVDKVPGGIGIYDIIDGKVRLTYLNDAYYEMLGVKRDDRLQYYGDNALAAIHDDDHEDMYQAIRHLMQGGDHVDVLHRVKNGVGRWVWLNLSASVVERKEGNLRVYASFSDCDAIIRTQQEMEEARNREQTLLASIPGGVAVYRLKKDGRFEMEYASEGLAKMCGYPQDEFMKKLHNDAMCNVVLEDIDMLKEEAKKCLDDRGAISVIYKIYHKNGTAILNRLDANLMGDIPLSEDDVAVWYAVHTLVSADSRLALREQHRYRSLMNALDMVLLEWEENTGFYASEKFNEYELSKESEEKFLKNQGNLQCVHPDDLPALNEFFAMQGKKKKRSSTILRMKMVDGTYRWTEMLGFYEYGEDNRIVRIIGILRDIDKERMEQNKRLRLALDDAQKANQAKTAFLSRVSHDMRTPLNGILGLTSILKNKVTDEDLLRDLAELELSGGYLLNLINDTLDVSRIESGRMELHPVVCDGRIVFENAMSLARQTILDKKIHFEVHVDELPFTMLYVDVSRIEQIIMNVLGNAAKFTPQGGNIDFYMSNVSMRDGVITDKIVVKDTGIGMNAEFIPHIFEAFAQEDASRTSSTQGTGLGMSITKQLLQLMGGDIEIESELGKGTTVTLFLPLQIATQGQIKESKMKEEDKLDGSALKGKRVLLCEDHPLNAMIAKKLLEVKGMEIEQAENGAIGVEKFENAKPGYYDIILMDIRMPVMDGIEAAKTIRNLSREDAGTIPIVAMTANAFDEDVRQTKEAGMDGHLSKPIQTEVFYSTLESLLKK